MLRPDKPCRLQGQKNPPDDTVRRAEFSCCTGVIRFLLYRQLQFY